MIGKKAIENSTEKHTEKVIIYTRVSSKKQVETGNGLESQEQICREWIRNQPDKIELAWVFSDGWVSGKYASRQGLDAMIEYLKQANKDYTKISKVIVDDFDRLIRDVQWWRDIKNRIEKLWWAKIFSLKQDLNDTPEGNMLQSITMSVKQYERENNARRTKDRQRWRLLNGFWCYNPMPGYNFQFEDEANKRWGRVLVLSEPNASIIKEGLELFAKGIILNIASFCSHIDKKWFITRTGWRITKNSDIDRMFTRDKLLFYAWWINYEKRDINMIKAKHPVLIDEDTMNKILERLDPKRFKIHVTNSKEKNIAELPLRWTLCCEGCKKPMTGSPSKNKLWNYYFYYTCRQKECSLYGKSINNNEVHKHFEEHLKSMKIEEHRLWLLEDILCNIWETEKDSLLVMDNRKEERLDSVIKEIDKVQERIFATQQESLISMYEKKLVELHTEQKEIEEEIAVNKSNHIDLPYIITNTKPILANPLFLWENPDNKLKSLMLSFMFSNQIFYNKKNGIQTPMIPLIYSLLSDSFSNKVLDQGQQDLNSRREALETSALPLSYGPIIFHTTYNRT